ncbi:MAG: heparinase II/III family protein [Spirochaetales bacterium]|nr:heparinase II/III family protein [Spirochaetales bacterium]
MVDPETLDPEKKARIREQGMAALEEGIVPLPASLYMDCRRTGNRFRFEKLYYRRRILLSRMMKAWLSGEESPGLLDGIINMLSTICDEWTWVIPAHNWPNDETGKALPPVDPPRVDLMAGNTATLMALTVYYLKDDLSLEADRLMERVKRECRRRCIDPYMKNDDHWWMGYTDHPEHGELNNWTPWITDNFLHTLLLLEPGAEEFKRAVIRSTEILNHYLDVLPPDGGCDEGAIYWDHAAGSLFGCLDLLDFVSGGSCGLMDDPFLKDAASYIHRVHIKGNLYANFADCPGVLDQMPFGLMYRMGCRLDDPELRSLAAELAEIPEDREMYEEAFSPHREFRNLLYPVKKENDAALPGAAGGSDVFPHTRVFIHKEKDLFVACKGGHNAESHNHNDIGQFMYYWKGQPGIIDPGVGEYTMNTFNHMRYTIWTMQSGWHNLPVVNGREQKEGAAFKSSRFETGDAFCRVGMETAYPEEAGIRTWDRDLSITREELTVQDTWEFKGGGNRVSWHFLCLDKPEISEGSIQIPLKEGQIILSFPGDKLQGTLDFQEVPEDDGKMGAWGRDRIWRICLEGSDLPAAGSMEFRITGR